MTEELEAAGDVVTGGLLAHATEPRDGEAPKVRVPSTSCLNCEVPLTGAYCVQCGQAALIHRSFYTIWHEFLHGVLHLDGKIWRTLPELALRPGRLTRRYIRGERAKFISPLALFLFSVFLMFAVSSLTGDEVISVRVNVNEEGLSALRDEVAKADRAFAVAQAKLDASGLTAEQRANLHQELEEAKLEHQAVARAHGLATGATGANADGEPGAFWRAVDWLAKHPEIFYYKVKTNAYKFSWALILISIPFVWLLFPFRREYKLYDHAVFVTYSITFVSPLFSVSMAPYRDRAPYRACRCCICSPAFRQASSSPCC